MPTITSLVGEGAFDRSLRDAINTNFTNLDAEFDKGDTATNPLGDVYLGNTKALFSADAAGTGSYAIIRVSAADHINPTNVWYPTEEFNFSEVSATGTAGTMISTGSTWVVHTTAGGCAAKILGSYSATSGDYATLRMRARSDYASGSAVGVVCGNFSASANLHNHANLYAVQGYAQPNAYTQNDAAHIACGVYSCIDATGASSGRRWSLWTDEHSTTKAAAGHYLHRLSYNPSAAGAGLDGVWTIYGPQTEYLINFEYDQAGAPFVKGAAVAAGACLGTIKVKCSNGDAGYINVYAAT